jgi:hypothetical protein
VATPASFPPLAPIELGDPADAGNGAGNRTHDRSHPEVITVARRAAVAADEDVAIAENLLAADAASLAGTDAAAVGDTVPSTGPSTGRPSGQRRPELLWVHEHLHHLSARAHTISGPAIRVAELRRTPWWR